MSQVLMSQVNSRRAVVLIAAFLYFVLTGSAFAIDRNQFGVEEVSYGDKKLQNLDVYFLNNEMHNGSTGSAKPVHVFIHGGAWRMGDKRRYDDMAEFYLQRDIVFVAVNYRLYPDHKHPAQIEDCAAAIQWIVSNIHRYGGGKDQLYLSGHSAGAHLSALLASDPRYLKKYGLRTDLFKGVFPVDTASFDFSQKTDTRGMVVRMVNNTINDNFGPEPEKLQDASPIFHAPHNLNLPPFQLFVTSERPGAVQQTQDYGKVLGQAGAPRSDVFVIKKLSHKEMAEAIFDEKSEVAQTILKAIIQ